MSSKQIEACAKRLPEPERSAFLSDQTRAHELIQEAAALRRKAWERYRNATRVATSADSPVTLP